MKIVTIDPEAHGGIAVPALSVSAGQREEGFAEVTVVRRGGRGPGPSRSHDRDSVRSPPYVQSVCPLQKTVTLPPGPGVHCQAARAARRMKKEPAMGVG